ncbi:hypothetical protein SUGI_0784450 [Cryptomeria japonica]|uniref:probable staphylococcal-like nuclease CAN1 n=1 Tax=Cryptomeria japonica TaxID=3369 RepID=UPI002414B92C|nr:probable staphylococcal-like nuclease CAN1 [Cryptomeria japonica]GLJ38497.1 hypothetical protein SUGI_0784450 [Cryptomeria japonica]
MGNALRYLCGDCLSPQTSEGAHEVIPGSTGFDLLARDLFQFENTAQVPEGLSQHVDALKKTQATWYKKILAAWKEDPPSNAEQAAILIVRTLQKQQKVHVQGLLAFYGLPYPIATTQAPEDTAQKWPQEVKYEFHTLQVDARAVLDGDSINVYVDTKSPRESAVVPISVQEATIERHEARARKDYARADPLKEQIESAGYRVFDANRNGDDVLARKYRIRLRGVDAPEGKQPYGKEAREALLNLVEGKCLRILVYGEDRYGRTVGDVYTRDVFVQEVLLKQGWVWHYTHYDKRPEFAEWQKQARAARVGIWASSNPQKPWDWRKERREGIAIETFA